MPAFRIPGVPILGAQLLGVLILGVLVLVVLVLGGCAGDPPPVTESLDVPAAPPEQTVSASVFIPALEGERGYSAPKPAPQARPAVALPKMASLAGVGESRVLALLGAPQFKRVDAPAELWQYRRDGCVLDLFLYPSSSGALAVDHLETRVIEAGSAAANGEACFAALVRAAQGVSGKGVSG